MKHSRRLLLLALLGSVGLPACATWPGLEDPTIQVAPQLALFRVKGRTQMESGQVLQQPQSLADLGAGKRDEEVGGRITYGDGFSGLEGDYLKVDMKSTEEGRTRHPWGAVNQGVAVNSRLVMDELRLRYIAALPWHYYNEDDESWFKAGGGIQLVHRELNFTVSEVNSTISQRIEVKDDLSPMLAIRLAGGRPPIDIQIDAAINNDWDLGTGDFDKRFYDFSIRGNYYLEAQNLTLFVGYRRFDTPSRGAENFQEFRTDFTFDGMFLGFQFAF